MASSSATTHWMRLALVTIASIACVRALRADEPVIEVDQAHAQIGQPEGVEALIYSVPPTVALVLDARGLDFAKTLYPGIRPNAVQLIVGEQRQFFASWHESGRVTLSPSTLSPINGASVFTGLVAGDEVIIAIGEQRVDEKTREIALKVLWAGLIEVKK